MNEMAEMRVFLDAMLPLMNVTERSEAIDRRRLGTAFRIASYSVGGYDAALNRVTADLLDPRGAHGQGPAFLKPFLEQISSELARDASCHWTVMQGYRTQCARCVDIALFDGLRTAIYIDSKPWADASAQELQSYVADLPAQPHEQKWLLSLSSHADADHVEINSAVRRQLGARFVIVPFARCGDGYSITRWLKECVRVCEADNVRAFVGDLAKYLETEFTNKTGWTSMNQDPFADALQDTVLRNRKHMEFVLRLEQMAPDLRRIVASKFIGDLKHALEAGNPGWNLESRFEKLDRGQQWLAMRKPSWPEGWGIRLSTDSAHLKNFVIGFCCPAREEHLREEKLDPQTPLAVSEDSASILAALTAPLAAIGETIGSRPQWPACCYLPAKPPLRHWNDAETSFLLAGLASMPDGSSALDNFVYWFEDLAHAVEACVDAILARRAQAGSR